MTHTYLYFTLYTNSTMYFITRFGKKYLSVTICWTFIFIMWLHLETIPRKDRLIFMKCFKDERMYIYTFHCIHGFIISWNLKWMFLLLNGNLTWETFSGRCFTSLVLRASKPWTDEIILNATWREFYSVSSYFLIGKTKKVICGLLHL